MPIDSALCHIAESRDKGRKFGVSTPRYAKSTLRHAA
jgi:hypothetical protein